MKAAIDPNVVKVGLVPQLDPSAFRSRCGAHEWPVLPLHCDRENNALAVIYVLRAHTAQKPNSQSGLWFQRNAATL